MMNRTVRIVVTATALSLGLLLAGCENFDPTAIFDAEIFNTKKKLPGERKPVFPEGTPGVSRGVPPELMKGYQPPAEEPQQAAVPEPPKPEAKPKPKPKPKVAAQPPAAPVQAQPQAQPQAQWPNAPAQQPQAAAGGGWPSPPSAPGGAAQPSGGPAWPEPPPPPPR